MKKDRLVIDDSGIRYTVQSGVDYLERHDHNTDIDRFMEDQNELFTRINQVVALTRSIQLLRHTQRCCESLPGDLVKLREELLHEIKEKHQYIFDLDWGWLEND